MKKHFSDFFLNLKKTQSIVKTSNCHFNYMITIMGKTKKKENIIEQGNT